METEKNIFIPKGNLKIPRRNMPQIQQKNFGDFFKWLRQNGINIKRVKKLGASLKPTQKEISKDVVKRLAATNSPKLEIPFLLTKDGHILDGHHRWLALLRIDRKIKVQGFEIGLNIKDALKIVRKYPLVLFKDTNNVQYFKSDGNLRLENSMDKTERDIIIDELQEQLTEVDSNILDVNEYIMVVENVLNNMKRKDIKEKPLGSFRDFMCEARRGKKRFKKPEDEIQIKGFGVVEVGILESMIDGRLKDLEKLRKRKSWGNIKALLDQSAIRPILDAIKVVEDENGEIPK